MSGIFIEKATDKNGESGYLLYSSFKDKKEFVLDRDIPEIPQIDVKILEEIRKDKRLFHMFDWEFVVYDQKDGKTCKTGHCRAGWAIALAGKIGESLRAKYGAEIAGALIYRKSRPGEPIPDFYCSDEIALKDIELCAERQNKQVMEENIKENVEENVEEKKISFREFF